MKPARVIIPGVAMVATIYGLSRYTYGLFVPDIRRDFQASVESLGLIASSSYASYMLATLLVPWVIARWGPRLPVLLGGLCATVGMFLIGIAPNIKVLTLGVIVAGASPGLAYPPVPETVERRVEPSHREKVLTIINSGTGFGVLLSAPLALISGAKWQTAWLGFSAFAAVSTFWNVWITPNKRQASSSDHGGTWKGWWGIRTRRLFSLALLVGVTTSVYWTFAVDFISSHGQGSTVVEKGFWSLVGIAGILGAWGGHCIEIFGLSRVLRFNLAGLALSMFLLALFPSQWFMLGLSAVLFGALFIMITGVFAVWSVRLFPSQPSVGYAAVFFLITAGQSVGPAIMGWISGHWGLSSIFWLAALIQASTLFVRLRESFCKSVALKKEA